MQDEQVPNRRYEDGNPGGYQQQQPWQQGPFPAHQASSPQPYSSPQPHWGPQNHGYPPSPKKKSGLIAGLVIGLVVLLGLGVGGFFLFKGDNTAATPTPGSTEAPSASTDPPKPPSTRSELMQAIRLSGPCEMHALEAITKFGPTTEVSAPGDLGTCVARAVTTLDGSKIDQAKPITLFDLTLGEPYYLSGPTKDISETAGNHTVFRSQTDNGDNANQLDTCVYYLPFSDFNLAAKLRTRQFLPGQSDNIIEWPQRCAEAKEYLTLIADRILALSPRKTPPTPPSLSTKDPCLARNEIAKQLPGWTLDTKSLEDPYIQPYSCIIKFTNPNENYSLSASITFTRGPVGLSSGETVSIGGLSGKRTPAFGLTVMVFRPADDDDENTAQTISVGILSIAKQGASKPEPSPEIKDKVTLAVVNSAK